MWSKNVHIKKDDQVTLGRDKWNNTKQMKSSESSEMNPQFLESSEMNIILQLFVLFLGLGTWYNIKGKKPVLHS